MLVKYLAKGRIMNKNQILDQFQEDLAHSGDHTKSSRSYYAQKWLDFAGDTPPEQWDKRLVQKFMKQVAKEGYAAGTQRNIYEIARRVFAAAGEVWESEKRSVLSKIDPHNPNSMPELFKVVISQPPSWPMAKRDGPVVGIDDVVKPALTFEEIETMIGAAKEGKLATDEAAFLALSTTYGLRREEMKRITTNDIDYNVGSIFIRTAKGGDPRPHKLATEIIPYLKRHDFNQEYSLFSLSRFYILIEHRAGGIHREGAGWHSIRRRLDALLMDRLSIPAVRLFLRWKVRSSSDMPLSYYSKDLDENDTEVLAVHPFTKLWEG